MGIHGETLTASSLGWFTEAGARSKFRGTPGPETLAWLASTRLAGRLRRYVTRQAGAARVEGRSVLPGAVAFTRTGGTLRHRARAQHAYVVAEHPD